MIDFATSAFVTLLLVVDPVGLVPAFLAATGGLGERDRARIAIRSPLIAAAILIGLALCGNWLLRQLRIGIPAFQIAGGLLLFGVSYQMIFGDRPHREARETGKTLAEHVSDDIAVFPLAIPLMAGPGAIATTLLLSGAAGLTTRLIIFIVIILLVCLICMLCFVLAVPIAKTLGNTGNAVLSRLLGILLAAYSVQFVLDGVASIRAGS